MYIMAKTIMVSNEVYEELKLRKEDRSFSELIVDLLQSNETKKGSGLQSCLGLLKLDKEVNNIEKTLKKGWKKWSKRYV